MHGVAWGGPRSTTGFPRCIEMRVDDRLPVRPNHTRSSGAALNRRLTLTASPTDAAEIAMAAALSEGGIFPTLCLTPLVGRRE
jgi:hypothetical protein